MVMKKVYLSSADMMTRNMIKRVEILFPVLNQKIARRLVAYLELQLNDNQKGRYQDRYGEYHYVQNDQAPLNSQEALMDEAITYGVNLKKENIVETGQPVRPKSNWVNRFKKKFNRK